MLGKMYRLILKRRVKGISYPVRFGNFLIEKRRQILNFDAAFLGGGLSHALTGNSI